MFANENYKADIKYTMELNNLIFRLLGIWPYTETRSSFFANIRRFAPILSYYFLLCCELIPPLLYIFIIEKRNRVRLKLIMPVLFTILSIFKYSTLVFSMNQMRECLTLVKDDWRNVRSIHAREFMIDKARTARHLLVVCGVFMYSSGIYFHTILPLSKGKSVTDQNITIRYLACPSYFVFFNEQISPAYEIVFVIQFLCGLAKYTITIAICSLAALFAMHICGQLKILMMLMKNLVNESEMKTLDEKLAVLVEHQIKIRNFLHLVQDTLEYTSLLEMMGCTIIICLLAHVTLTEWENQNIVAMSSYFTLFASIVFNIFIFCFIGEQLSIEGEKVALTTCTLAWYRLPDEKARALILIIAMSNISIKLRAGKFIDLSIKSFGDVIKTAVGYFNLMRRIMY